MRLWGNGLYRKWAEFRLWSRWLHATCCGDQGRQAHRRNDNKQEQTIMGWTIYVVGEVVGVDVKEEGRCLWLRGGGGERVLAPLQAVANGRPAPSLLVDSIACRSPKQPRFSLLPSGPSSFQWSPSPFSPLHSALLCPSVLFHLLGVFPLICAEKKLTIARTERHI